MVAASTDLTASNPIQELNLFKCVRLSLCFAFQSVDVQLAFTAFAPVAAQCQ